MPIITRLVAGKRNPNRVNLYLDGIFSFALSLDEVVKHGLKKWLELSEEQISSLKQTDKDDQVYTKIINFISFRPRSVKEVRDRLNHYGAKDLIAQNLLIDRLKRGGYLDDLKFATWFVESRNTHKLRSPRALMAELSAKGISREVQAQVLSQVNDSATTIQSILTKKLGSPRVLSPEERQKISSYLVRQGFAWDQVRQVVKQWESE